MRKFLEIEEQQTPEEIDLGIPPEFIRIEVTGKSKEEIELLCEKLEREIKKPKAFIHECFHDETPPRPCQRKELAKLSKSAL